MTNTKATGDRTEARILHALLERGYSVSVPFGDNDRYDLVVDTGSTLLRVQCKTDWLEGECVRFKTGSQTTVDGETRVVDYADGIDAFAVRCADSGALYWVPVEEAGRKRTYLRVADPEIEHPSVNQASEYRLDRKLQR